MRFAGTVKFWNADRGFGFAMRDDGGADVFVHVNELRNLDVEELPKGARIDFEIGTNARNGKTEARDVAVVSNG